MVEALDDFFMGTSVTYWVAGAPDNARHAMQCMPIRATVSFTAKMVSEEEAHYEQ